MVHDQGGLSLLTRADVTLWALTCTQAFLDGRADTTPGHVIAAVPVPGSSPDTAIANLYVSPGTVTGQCRPAVRQAPAREPS